MSKKSEKKFEQREATLRTFISRECSKRGLDSSAFDAHAEVDLELSVYEQQDELRKKFGWFDEVVVKRQAEELQHADYSEQNRLRDEEIRRKEVEVLAKLASNGDKHGVFEKVFGGIQSLAEVFATSQSIHSLIVHGQMGLGKTHTVLTELSRHYSADKLRVVSGHITFLRLYQILYEVRDGGVVVLDDIPLQTLRNPLFSAMMKAATWSVTGQRVVAWASTSKLLEKEGLPQSFVFSGKIAVLANELPRSDDFRAVMDRALVKGMSLDLSTIKEIFLALAEQEFGKLSRPERLEVAEWLVSKVNPAIGNLSIRTLVKCFAVREWNPVRWRDVASGLLETDECKLVVVRVQERYPDSVSSQAQLFSELTGFSRRTFFRVKKEMGV